MSGGSVCAEEGLVDRLASMFHSRRWQYEAELQRLDADLGSGLNDHCVLLAPAAKGDVAAQRHLALIAAVQSLRSIAALPSDQPSSPIPSLVEAVVFARLAAAHGEECDRTLLIFLLSLAAIFAGEADYAAEALAWIEVAADQGDELADQAIAREVGNEPAEVLATAKDIHAAFVRHGVGMSRKRIN